MEISLFIKGELLKDQILEFVSLIINTPHNSCIKYLDADFAASKNCYGSKPEISFQNSKSINQLY